MNDWAILILGLQIFGLFVHMAYHGNDKKPEKYNFYRQFFYFIIQSFILYQAGVYGNN